MATTRAATLDYVLTVMDFDEEAKRYLIQKDVTNIRRFAALSDNTFILFVNSDRLINEAHMIEFKLWL